MYKIALFFTLLSFASATLDPFIATTHTGYTPSDAGIASSPNRILTAVNGNLSLFNKDGTKRDSKSAITFHGHSFVFDPRVNWDFFDERLIIVQVSTTSPSTSRIVIATSKSADPDSFNTDLWSRIDIEIFEYSGDTHWADFPIVGLDEFNLYIRYNAFSSTNSFRGDYLITIPKANLMLDRTLERFEYHAQSVSPSLGRNAFTTLTEAKLGEPVYTVQYSPSKITMFELVNRASGAPELTNFKVINFDTVRSGFSESGTVQKGSSVQVLSGPSHFNNAYYKDGMTYAVASFEGVNERYLVVYRIDHVNNVVDEIQEISDNSYLFFPSLAIDKFQNVGILAYSSSADRYISTAHTSMDSEGTIIEPLRIEHDGTFSYARTRYGDYSATAIDPDGVNIWSLSQIPAGSDRWNAWITNICPSCTTEPTECEEGYIDFPECDKCDENYYRNGTLCLECPDCGLFGNCNINGTCTCQAGHSGDRCELCCTSFYGNDCLPCPECVNGFCDSGKLGTGLCICAENYDGLLCDECREGYYGDNCEPCPNCNGRGTCDESTEGKCSCFEQFSGPNCLECAPTHYGANCVQCPECVNGECGEETDGLCVCDDDIWTGNLCDVCVGTPEECGFCDCGVHGTCVEEMTFKPVANNTPLNGTYICICDVGWDPDTNCSTCEDGYVGSNCVECQDCNGNGECSQETGQCLCDENYALPDCRNCIEGFYGEDCLPCPNCNEGECTSDGGCECPDNFINQFCDECAENHFGANCVLCPDCGLNGVCNDGITGNGQCICNEGWARDTDGRCTVCAEGFYGNNCLPCPNCGPNGFCDETTNGLCSCAEGWNSALCNQCAEGYFPPNCDLCSECLGVACSSTEGCLCGENSGQTGVRCHLCAIDDENACNGRGTCNVAGQCQCREPFSGKFCEQGEELLCDFCECKEPFGMYIDGSCVCNEGFFGKNCKQCLEGNLSPACPYRDCNYPNGHNISPNVCSCINGYGSSDCSVELTCQ